MLGCIGETMDSNSQICGAVVSARGKKSKITIWTKDAANSTDIIAIGANIRKLLDLPKEIKLDYLV